MKKNVSFVIAICTILIASYAVIAVSNETFHKNRLLLDSIHHQQDNINIKLVTKNKVSHLASLEHRLYANSLKDASYLIDSAQVNQLAESDHVRCEVICSLEKF